MMNPLLAKARSALKKGATKLGNSTAHLDSEAERKREVMEAAGQNWLADFTADEEPGQPPVTPPTKPKTP